MAKTFLKSGNGHQLANRAKSLEYVLKNLEGVTKVDDSTVDFPPHGRCHFAAYTHPKGAMISTPNRDDNEFGSGDWHSRDAIMLFRDVGDGRCFVYVCPIAPLFELRTIGQHGVRWEDVFEVAKFKRAFKTQ